MDSLPDPMKLQLPVVGFVIVLLALLFLFLKASLFKPLAQLMDEREAAMRAGDESKIQAAARIEARQAEYEGRMKELRSRAFEHRKKLAEAATGERDAILEKARQEAAGLRDRAMAELRTEQQAAEAELRTQIDALSESMAQHLLKQA